MKKKIILLTSVVFLVLGFAANVQASHDYRFVNHCDANLSVDFYTHTFFCVDHHSSEFAPGQSWNCSTNCPLTVSVTINYRGQRYPQTGSPGTGGTWGVVCTKLPDGSYKVNIQGE